MQSIEEIKEPKKGLEIKLGMQNGGLTITSIPDSDRIGVAIKIKTEPGRVAKLEQPSYRTGCGLTFKQFCVLIAQMSAHRDKVIFEKLNSGKVDPIQVNKIVMALSALAEASENFDEVCGAMGEGGIIVNG
jgi:hypothetical protein